MTKTTPGGAEARALADIERHTEAIAEHLRSLNGGLVAATRALVSIGDALRDSNVARDRWARAVVHVLEDAKGAGGADTNSG
ncbi:hypothetical protein [Amycolatopsis dendrobii]|uniref:Uncharacterized protein n=1 Tax=Amycolatopsis dendrobii TaxID=2760662 RepID=A0A7W3VUK9_9PSEU|nr:hypothetical protein [Amycolatopsis dendrobii]MBB1153473.1 hypothetical protein [Amycolatopsis dendrobii]